MNYKYEIGQQVKINSIVKAPAEILGRWRPDDKEVNLYQVKVLEGNHKDKELWFAEHEIEG